MATLGDLVVKLSMDAAGFTSDAGRAAYAAEKSMARVVAAGNVAANVITGLAKSFASMAVEAVKTMPAVADAVAEQVDALEEAAEAAGISAVAYQKLQLAMQEAGVSTEQFDSGMKKLSQSIVDAAEDADGKAAVAFQRLGISVKNADGSLKTVDQTIAELSARFQTLPAGPEKVAIAVELMGKAGAKWIPALNSDLEALGKKAEEAGAIFSNDLTKGAQDYKQALAELSIAQQGLKNQIAENMLVPMTEAAKVTDDLVRALTEWASTSDKITGAGAREFFRDLARAAAFTVDVFNQLANITVTLGEGLAVLAFSATQYAEAADRIVHFDLAGAKQSIQNIDDAIEEWRTAAAKRFQTEPFRVRLEMEFAESDVRAAADAATRQARELAGALKALGGGGGPQPLGAAPGNDKKKKPGKSEAEKAEEELAKATARLDRLQQQSRDKEIAQVEAAAQKENEAVADANERLLKLEEKNAEAAVEISRKASAEELAIWQAQQAEIEAMQQAIGQRIKDNFGGPLADALTDLATGARSAGEAFRDMASNIGEAMTRLAAEQVAQSFTDWLFKGTGTGGSSGFGEILGSIFGGTFGGTFQHGGVFTGNRMIRVGENGPEMIHTSVGGRVEPIKNEGTTHNNVSVNVNVPPSSDRRTADQIAASVGIAVGRAMRRIQ